MSDEPPYDELLRCLENDWNISASWDGLRKFWCIELTEEGVRLRDEWNARAERTCENVAKSWGEFECSECGFYADFGSDLHRVHVCPDCRKAVSA